VNLWVAGLNNSGVYAEVPGLHSARCMHFAYLSNTAGAYSPLIYQTALMRDYAKRKYGFVNFLHFTGYLHMLAFRSPVLPSFILP
jgi:hypothetical protein